MNFNQIWAVVLDDRCASSPIDEICLLGLYESRFEAAEAAREEAEHYVSQSGFTKQLEVSLDCTAVRLTRRTYQIRWRETNELWAQVHAIRNTED